MNRQALAFLTMFSLILMLSVYYVTLPTDTTSVMTTESGEDLSDPKDAQSGKENEAEKLQEEITSKQEEEVKKQSDIVSDTQSSEEAKKEALETLETLKDEEQQKTALKDALQKGGFVCAIEITEGTCKINVFDSEDNEANAKKVMDLAHQTLGQKYLIEVTFK